MNIAFPLLLLAVPTPPSEDLYERVVSEALVGAQTELVSRLDLWVDHSNWDTAWEYVSPNYRVRTTHSYHLAKRLGLGLEDMLGHFQRVLNTTFTPSEPLDVWVWPTIGDYNDFGDNNGAEHSSFYGSFYANQHPERPVATFYRQNETELQMWLTHSAFHQCVERAFSSGLPASIDEGLAAYFSLYWDENYGIQELERITASDADYIPLIRLLNDPIQNYGNRTNDRFIELGMLFNYLLHYREDTRWVDGEDPEAPFVEYLRAAVRGQSSRDLEFHRLLNQNLAGIEEDFRAYDFSSEAAR